MTGGGERSFFSAQMLREKEVSNVQKRTSESGGSNAVYLTRHYGFF